LSPKKYDKAKFFTKQIKDNVDLILKEKQKEIAAKKKYQITRIIARYMTQFLSEMEKK